MVGIIWLLERQEYMEEMIRLFSKAFKVKCKQISEECASYSLGGFVLLP